MRVHGTAAIADLLGDFVAYRSLRPVDARLPDAQTLLPALGIAPGTPLRKGDVAYARVVAALLGAARRLDAPSVELARLIVVGDTRMSDGGAFTTLCAATGWGGRAFIGQDAAAAPAATREGGATYANRWTALHDFAAALDYDGFLVDAQTVVALDLDKTLIGARGRNDALIDTARATALRATIAETLGADFDQAAFEQTHTTFNQTRYHPFTGDNQDYVGYICVMICGGAMSAEALVRLVKSGQVAHFADFVALMSQRVQGCSAALQRFHREIAACVAVGDPTPFKAFRRREYAETAARMGTHADDTPAAVLLREELVLTGEVWDVLQAWRERGALILGLSDKPDEAALPTEADAAAGALPLHRIRTHIVGNTK